jgi:hypothetical protein
MGAAFGEFEKRPAAAECSDGAPGRAAGDGAGRGLAVVLSARQMIVDIIGYLLADGRQLKHLIFDDRIVGLLGKLPIHHRLVPQIVG